MHRFFVPPDAIAGGVAHIVGDDARQLSRVLRAKAGMVVTVLDGTGVAYEVELEQVSDAQVCGAIRSRFLSRGEPSLGVAIVQGLPKGDKLEAIIQKCTELGAEAVYPVATCRSVVRLGDGRAADRLLRWRRVAKEAAEQANRGIIPLVGELTEWQVRLRSLAEAGYHMLVLWEGESAQGLFGALRDYLSLPEVARRPRIALCVGPEGGLDSGEVAYARSLGALSVTMGTRILRTETAGPAAVACAMAASGDLP